MCHYEQELLKIKCNDEYTLKWFHKEFFNITHYKGNTTKPLTIVSEREKTFIEVKIIMNQVFVGRLELLQQFHKQNPGLDVSRWEIIGTKECQDEVEITFKVDPLSFKKIKDNNFILNINGHQLKIDIVKNLKGKSSSSLMSKKNYGKTGVT